MSLLRIVSAMTPSPRSVGLDQSLADAARYMREHGVRHLPVSEGGILRGVLSERDVALVEALEGVDPAHVKVEAAMTPDPFAVSSDTPLAEVVQAMVEHGHGCAIVTDGGGVCGLLTTRDALRVLWEHLAAEDAMPDDVPPSRVRKMILREHRRIRGLLDAVDALAARALENEAEVTGELRAGCGRLLTALAEHIELEDRVLAPALRETPGFGEVREAQLVGHHEEQLRTLERITGKLESIDDAVTLGREIRAFVADVRLDMAHEDRDLLSPGVLKDDPIHVDFLG